MPAIKRPPAFVGTDRHNVVITLFGEIQDARFVRYLEKVGREKLASFSALDFLVLDHVRRDVAIPEVCTERIPKLLQLGVIERVGKRQLMLSKALYEFLGERGSYTRTRGLAKETEKALVEQHLREVARDGATLNELLEVLRADGTRRRQVQLLLQEMRREGRIHIAGQRRLARWHLGPQL